MKLQYVRSLAVAGIAAAGILATSQAALASTPVDRPLHGDPCSGPTTPIMIGDRVVPPMIGDRVVPPMIGEPAAEGDGPASVPGAPGATEGDGVPSSVPGAPGATGADCVPSPAPGVPMPPWIPAPAPGGPSEVPAPAPSKPVLPDHA